MCSCWSREKIEIEPTNVDVSCLQPHQADDLRKPCSVSLLDQLYNQLAVVCALSIFASQVGVAQWLGLQYVLPILCSGVALKAVAGRMDVPKKRNDVISQDTTDIKKMKEAGVPADRASAVAQLSSRICASGAEALSDPLTLLRFLSSRENDVDAAFMMYKETLEWRASYHMDKVMARFGEGEAYSSSGNRCRDASSWHWFRCSSTAAGQFAQEYGFFGRLKVSALDGSPVAIWRFGAVDWIGLEREGLVELMEQALLSHMEDLLQAGRAASRHKDRLIRARLVIDAAGMDFGLRRHLGIVKKLLQTGKLYFPEVTCSTTVVQAPRCLEMGYSLVKPLMTPLMRSKVCILGTNFAEGLRRHAGLSVDELPMFLGGQIPNDLVGRSNPVPVGLGSRLRSMSP